MNPKKLKIGDTIGIIAPSSTIKTLSDEQINRSYGFLKGHGLKVKEHPQCRIDDNSLAGSINDRVSAIHQFVRDDSIKCIMSFWGGWNTNQIIEHLDYKLIKKYPKIFIGYSDTCALLSSINTKTGITTYMGPGGITFSKPDPIEYSWEYFKKICVEKSRIVKVKPSNEYADDQYFLYKSNKRQIKANNGLLSFRGGMAEGRVVASNLSTLLVLLGTEYFPIVDNCILFLEEAEDFNYLAIHRMLTQAKQAGIFKKINGLVIGKFMEKSIIDSHILREILSEVLDETSFPVITGANFGHSDPIFTIPIGASCKINADIMGIEFIL